MANVFWNGDQLLEVVVNYDDDNDDDAGDDDVMLMTSISCSKWSSTKMKQFSLTIWWCWSRSVGLPYIGPGTIT